ncbi:MAG: tetratricopeptide repeat protein, partial [Acidobacteriota bacterium]
MKQSLILVALAMAAGFFWVPTQMHGQNSKEVNILQRDIYDVGHKLDAIQTTQGQRLDELTTLLKQALEANTKMSAEMQALQQSMTKNQTEQQNRLFEPLAGMKSSVGEVTENVSALQATLTSLGQRQSKLETSIANIEGLVKLLYNQAQAAPTPQTAASVAPAGPTPDQAALLLFGKAQADKLAGNDDVAFNEFVDVYKSHPTSPQAPMAVYELAQMYVGRGQHDQALDAFDQVLEQFSDNPMWKEAQYGKAEQLAELKKRSEAAKEFDTFARKYPAD